MGCKKPEENKAPTVIVVEDSIVVTHNSAILYANVTAKGGSDVTECGFCYAKQGENSDTLFCAGSDGFFSVELTDLLPSTAYSCKAFADNAIGRGYSETFTRLNPCCDGISFYLIYLFLILFYFGVLILVVMVFLFTL